MTQEELKSLLEEQNKVIADKNIQNLVNIVMDIYEKGLNIGIIIGKHEMLNKACEWLNKGGYFINNKESLEDFCKIMEE